MFEIKSRNLLKRAINVECQLRSRLIACEVLRGRLARRVRGRANREKVKHVARPLRNNTMIITSLLVYMYMVYKSAHGVDSSRRRCCSQPNHRNYMARNLFRLVRFTLMVIIVYAHFCAYPYNNQEPCKMQICIYLIKLITVLVDAVRTLHIESE